MIPNTKNTKDLLVDSVQKLNHSSETTRVGPSVPSLWTCDITWWLRLESPVVEPKYVFPGLKLKKIFHQRHWLLAWRVTAFSEYNFRPIVFCGRYEGTAWWLPNHWRQILKCQTHRMQISSCSLLETSAVSSAMVVKNIPFWMFANICRHCLYKLILNIWWCVFLRLFSETTQRYLDFLEPVVSAADENLSSFQRLFQCSSLLLLMAKLVALSIGCWRGLRAKSFYSCSFLEHVVQIGNHQYHLLLSLKFFGWYRLSDTFTKTWSGGLSCDFVVSTLPAIVVDGSKSFSVPGCFLIRIVSFITLVSVSLVHGLPTIKVFPSCFRHLK